MKIQKSIEILFEIMYSNCIIDIIKIIYLMGSDECGGAFGRLFLVGANSVTDHTRSVFVFRIEN